jgi:hypothetical protein
MMFKFTLEPYKLIRTRQVETIWDLLAEIGGLWGILVATGYVLMKFLSFLAPIGAIILVPIAESLLKQQKKHNNNPNS